MTFIAPYILIKRETVQFDYVLTPKKLYNFHFCFSDKCYATRLYL